MILIDVNLTELTFVPTNLAIVGTSGAQFLALGDSQTGLTIGGTLTVPTTWGSLPGVTPEISPAVSIDAVRANVNQALIAWITSTNQLKLGLWQFGGLSTTLDITFLTSVGSCAVCTLPYLVKGEWDIDEPITAGVLAWSPDDGEIEVALITIGNTITVGTPIPIDGTTAKALAIEGIDDELALLKYTDGLVVKYRKISVIGGLLTIGNEADIYADHVTSQGHRMMARIDDNYTTYSYGIDGGSFVSTVRTSQGIAGGGEQKIDERNDFVNPLATVGLGRIAVAYWEPADSSVYVALLLAAGQNVRFLEKVRIAELTLPPREIAVGVGPVSIIGELNTASVVGLFLPDANEPSVKVLAGDKIYNFGEGEQNWSPYLGAGEFGETPSSPCNTTSGFVATYVANIIFASKVKMTSVRVIGYVVVAGLIAEKYIKFYTSTDLINWDEVSYNPATDGQLNCIGKTESYSFTEEDEPVWLRVEISTNSGTAVINKVQFTGLEIYESDGNKLLGALLQANLVPPICEVYTGNAGGLTLLAELDQVSSVGTGAMLSVEDDIVVGGTDGAALVFIQGDGTVKDVTFNHPQNDVRRLVLPSTVS